MSAPSSRTQVLNFTWHTGNDGSHTFRIPGLVRTTAGTVLASYDVHRYSNSDLQGNIDIGISRSINGECSWEPMRVAMHKDKSGHDSGGLPKCFNGISDACILVDADGCRVYIFVCWMHGLRDSNGKFRED